MAAAWSAASTGIEPGERDGYRERDADRDRRIETDLSRLHRLRLATLRLADGARVSRETIEHGKAAAVLPNDVRRGAIMLVLARVGLSMPKCERDCSDYIC
jgi:hypothetical protein